MDNSPVSVVSDGELEESGQLIIPLRNLISLAVNIALLIIVLLPLIGTSFNFGPAWPGGLLTIPVLTSFANLLVLIYVFRFWSNLRPRGLKLRMTIFLIVLVLSLLGYWAIFNTYTYPIIGTGGRIVGGFTLTPIATEFMNRGGPVPIHDLLLNFGLDPALVWTRSSIAAVNASLSALWVLTFLGLTVIIGALTLSLPRRAAGSIFFVKSQSTKEAQLERVIERVEKEPEKAKPAWDLARVTLELYFDRNLSQINYIFWFSVLVMTIGFAFLLYSVRIAFVATQSNITTPAIISGFAGVITEFIGATFLFLYRSTIQQASSYTKTLERINSVGMAMQILDTISPDSKDLQDKTKAEIVKILLLHPGGLPSNEQVNDTTK